MLKAQNYLLAKYILKSLTHGKYELLKNISFTKFMGTMLITHGKTIHFCKDDQAQRSSTTKPN